LNYSFINNQTLSSAFIAEDYFPIIIRYSDEELNNRFAEYSYKDSDMFELVSDSKTGIIKQFTLTLCNNYKMENAKLVLPEYIEGVLCVQGNEPVACDMFCTHIYSDGVKVCISEKESVKHMKCGHLILSFTEEDELTTVYIVNLSETEINHVKAELSEG